MVGLLCLNQGSVALAYSGSELSPAATGPAEAPLVTNWSVLSSPHSQLDGAFGTSVAVSGGIVAVGSYQENASGFTAAGVAYLFSLKGGHLLKTLSSPNPQASARFGWSVAIGGGVVVVGAPSETVSGVADAGRAYVFSTTGSLLATLVSPGLTNGGVFGSAVGVSGSRIIVGAPFESIPGHTAVGHAYLFKKTGALIAQLTSPLAEFFENDNFSLFGSAVAISGQNAIVGACQEDAPGFSGAGHAYVFRSSTGVLEQILTSPAPQAGGCFGSSVAVHGQTVIVGAQFENVGSFSESGHAYGFRASTGQLTAVFTAPSQANQSYFGASVAVSRAGVLVGAPDAPHESVVEAGQAYTFTLGGSLMSAFVSPSPQGVGTFGASVAASGAILVVGAPGEEAGGYSGAGQVYVS